MVLHRIYVAAIFFAATAGFSGVRAEGNKNSSEKARGTKHIEVKTTRENFVKPMDEVRKQEKSADSSSKQEHKDKDQSIVHEGSNRPTGTAKSAVSNDKKSGSVKNESVLNKRQGQTKANSIGKR